MEDHIRLSEATQVHGNQNERMAISGWKYKVKIKKRSRPISDIIFSKVIDEDQ